MKLFFAFNMLGYLILATPCTNDSLYVTEVVFLFNFFIIVSLYDRIERCTIVFYQQPL
jgi:hypothetical protein